MKKILLLAAICGYSSAATITWGPATAITGSTTELIEGSVVSVIDTGTVAQDFYRGPATTGPTTSYGFTAADYEAFLDDILFIGSPYTETLTGLVVGQAYEVQTFYVDNRGPFDSRTQTVDGQTTLNAGIGEFTIGTFVAMATTQDIVFENTAQVHLNGIILAAVPEPSSVALLSLGGLSLLSRRKR